MTDAFELNTDGHKIGRDPRKMTPDELKSLGHVPMSPLEALRARCIDCCGHSKDEVRKCTAVACPSWPFRMETSPWRQSKSFSPEQRESARERMKAMRAKQLGRE